MKFARTFTIFSRNITGKEVEVYISSQVIYGITVKNDDGAVILVGEKRDRAERIVILCHEILHVLGAVVHRNFDGSMRGLFKIAADFFSISEDELIEAYERLEKEVGR